MKLTFSIDIEAAPETVFDLVTDIERMPEWMDSLTESHWISGFNPDMAAGSKFRQRAVEMGQEIEYEGEVSIYERPTRFGIKVVSKNFTLEIGINIAPTGDGVRLEYTAEMTKASLTVRLLASAFESKAQEILERQLDNLKTLAESQS